MESHRSEAEVFSASHLLMSGAICSALGLPCLWWKPSPCTFSRKGNPEKVHPLTAVHAANVIVHERMPPLEGTRLPESIPTISLRWDWTEHLNGWRNAA